MDGFSSKCTFYPLLEGTSMSKEQRVLPRIMGFVEDSWGGLTMGFGIVVVVLFLKTAGNTVTSWLTGTTATAWTEGMV